ncbi:hypothetical protein ABPG74_013895 [Tetrahymena malaccensis]
MNKAILLLALLAVCFADDTTPYYLNLTNSFTLKPLQYDNTTNLDYCFYNKNVQLIPTQSATNASLYTGFNVTGQAQSASFSGCPAYYLTFVDPADQTKTKLIDNTQKVDFQTLYVTNNITNTPSKLILSYVINNATNSGNATAQLPAFRLTANNTFSTTEQKLQAFQAVVNSSAFKLAAAAVFALFALLF